MFEGETLAVCLELTCDEQASMVKGNSIIPVGFVSLDLFLVRKLWPRKALTPYSYEQNKLLEQMLPELADDTVWRQAQCVSRCGGRHSVAAGVEAGTVWQQVWK